MLLERTWTTLKVDKFTYALFPYTSFRKTWCKIYSPWWNQLVSVIACSWSLFLFVVWKNGRLFHILGKRKSGKVHAPYISFCNWFETCACIQLGVMKTPGISVEQSQRRDIIMCIVDYRFTDLIWLDISLSCYGGLSLCNNQIINHQFCLDWHSNDVRNSINDRAFCRYLWKSFLFCTHHIVAFSKS